MNQITKIGTQDKEIKSTAPALEVLTFYQERQRASLRWIGFKV